MKHLLLISVCLAMFGMPMQLPATPVSDPALSDGRALAERIGRAPESFLQQFRGEPGVKVFSHTVTPAERTTLIQAFAALTPLQRDILKKRLHEILFVDGMPNNALTFPVDAAAGKRSYDIAVRAGALHETISQLVSRKERTVFDTHGSDMSVTVDAGQLNAMVYVLLHESMHVVDGVMGETPDTGDARQAHPLVSGIWRDRLTPADAYRQPLLMSVAYRHDGHSMPIAKAPDVYNALARTPFISLYGSSNWHDDIAELLAWTELTGRLHQPYRIVIRKGSDITSVFEPATSRLVQARLKDLARLTGSAPALTS